ncbi:hypothetical protein RI129_012101 [Pyrocoelia pectoralis]|uniref:Death domain-containing protein n=1 Tax=Pyrocoelia pectoralis TaxID=417401 RepID=A0AAN7V418_9COLE
MDMDTNIETDASPNAPIPDEKIIGEKESNGGRQPLYSSKKGHSKPKRNSCNTTQNIVNVHNCNGVHFGTSVTVEAKTDKKVRQKPKVMTELVSKLTQNEDTLTLEIRLLVKKYVGENWKDVFRILGYSEGEITQVELQHNVYGIGEVVYQLLIDWSQNKPKEAKLGKLVSALWNAGEVDVVEKILKNFPLK